MKCQKCRLREAVTFNAEIQNGQMRILFVCQECNLPMMEGAFASMTAEARQVLIRAGREITDPASVNRVRPALLYYLLEDENAPFLEALRGAGIDPSVVREEIAAFLSGEAEDRKQWVSTRGITPIVVGARNAARRIGHEGIAPEHLFLGMIESPEPGDPWVMIRLAGLVGDIEKNLTPVTAV